VELPPFPWRYPFQEDGPRLGSVVLRPVVPISFVGSEISVPVYALVDSGCEHVLAAPWLAPAVGVDLGNSHREINLGLGGDTVRVRFVDLTLRLHAPTGGDDHYFEWQAEVGFIKHWKPTWPALVGQCGFLNEFTVTMSRHAQELAIEAGEVYDERFPVDC
jgi:hypothetical protein